MVPSGCTLRAMDSSSTIRSIHFLRPTLLLFDSREPINLTSVASLALNLVDRVDERNVEMLASGIQA
jgi:hypothetical protein